MPQEVVIQEVTAQVRVMDSRSLLDPRTLSIIVRAVLQAVEEEKRAGDRRRADTRTGQSNAGEAK
jgi:hypothetical protein